MKTRIISSVMVFLAILATGMLGVVAQGGVPGAQKLEGAWIAKVDGVPAQWTYVISADSSGRLASGHGSIDAGFWLGELFDTDKSSPILISMAMTGPETGVADSVWYGFKALPPPSLITYELVYIGTVDSTFTFVGADKLVGLHNFAIYAAAQDIDGDGLPEPDQAPVYSFQVTTQDTRLPSPR